MEGRESRVEEQGEVNEIQMTERQWAMLKELSDLDIGSRIRGIKETIRNHRSILENHTQTLAEQAQQGEEVNNEVSKLESQEEQKEMKSL